MSRARVWLAALAALAVTACEPAPSPGPSPFGRGEGDDPALRAPSPGPSPFRRGERDDPDVPPQGGRDGEAVAGGPEGQTPTGTAPHFSESGICGDCHSNAARATAMRTADAEPIAPYDLWRGTMMANAARDPFWRAQVAAEVAAAPHAAAELEGRCMTCHAPMLAAAARLSGAPPPRLSALDGRDEAGRLGRDGVSCTVCHQIQPDGLGTAATFDGHFLVGDARIVYGPHAEPWGEIMALRSGYTPQHGAHLTQSALCGSCHTLVGEPLDAPDGAPPFVEQAAYLEWRNSAYNDEGEAPGALARSCQGCHVPTRDDALRAVASRIARNPHGGDFARLEARSPFGRHVFVGGNTLVPALLREHAETLGVRAPPEAFDATIARAREQLGERTASLALEARRDGEALVIAVRVGNLAGHKLPTGFPSRRVWLRLEVVAADDSVLFDSGGFDDRGRILDGAGRVAAFEQRGGPLGAHLAGVIDAAGQVQIYEQQMADLDGAPTWLVSRAATHASDNRLLPTGWRDDHADAGATRPVGTAGDTDFVAGADTVRYRVAVTVPGPYTVRATLHYQVISARWLAELAAWSSAPPVAAFLAMLEQAELRPETLATATTRVR